MKMVMIVYNAALDEEVSELLESAGLAFYTKWTRVLGRGEASGSHLGTQVWPGMNNVVFLATEEDRVPALLCGVRELRRKLGREGIKAFVLPLEEIT